MVHQALGDPPPPGGKEKGRRAKEVPPYVCTASIAHWPSYWQALRVQDVVELPQCLTSLVLLIECYEITLRSPAHGVVQASPGAKDASGSSPGVGYDGSGTLPCGSALTVDSHGQLELGPFPPHGIAGGGREQEQPDGAFAELLLRSCNEWFTGAECISPAGRKGSGQRESAKATPPYVDQLHRILAELLAGIAGAGCRGAPWNASLLACCSSSAARLCSAALSKPSSISLVRCDGCRGIFSRCWI